jgi:hypothetical protein
MAKWKKVSHINHPELSSLPTHLVRKQRQKRRQAKKQIVSEPKILDPDPKAEKVPKTSKRRGTCQESLMACKLKEGLPAGLALMHGFNPKNIGKHRITVSGYVTAVVALSSQRRIDWWTNAHRCIWQGPCLWKADCRCDKG